MEVFDLAPVKFEEDEMLVLDQTKLPAEEVYIKMKTKEDVWDAIHTLKVRGAPAIGVAAAYGLYVSTRDFAGPRVKEFREYVRETSAYLNTARPTAVNLSWALKRCEDMLDKYISAFDNAADGFLCTCEHCAGDQVTTPSCCFWTRRKKSARRMRRPATRWVSTACRCFRRAWGF